MNWQLHIVIVTMLAIVHVQTKKCTWDRTYNEAASAIGIRVADVDSAGMNGDIMGRIQYKDAEDTWGSDGVEHHYVWTPWKNLDHSNCNDFERGKTNWFSFTGREKYKEWLKLDIVNCDNDGVKIDAIYKKYANDNAYSNSATESFRVQKADGTYEYYDGLWLDKDGTYPRLEFDLWAVVSSEQPNVQFLRTTPRTIRVDCPAEGTNWYYYAHQDRGNLEFDVGYSVNNADSGLIQFLFFDVMISAVSTLFVIAVCLGVYYCMKKRKTGEGRVIYQKVKEEEDTEAQDQMMQ